MFFLTGWAIPLIIFATIGVVPTNNLPTPAHTFGLEISPPPSPLQPSASPTPSPTPTPSPSLAPSPTHAQAPTTSPKGSPSSAIKAEPEEKKAEVNVNASGDVPLSIMQQINDFRASNGLPPFSTEGYTCGFANLRAGEVANDFSHSGFRGRIDGNSLPYPGFSGISENIAMNSDPGNVVQSWIDSPGHNENLRKSHAHACVGRNGSYYVFESWNP